LYIICNTKKGHAKILKRKYCRPDVSGIVAGLFLPAPAFCVMPP